MKGIIQWGNVIVETNISLLDYLCLKNSDNFHHYSLLLQGIFNFVHRNSWRCRWSRWTFSSDSCQENIPSLYGHR